MSNDSFKFQISLKVGDEMVNVRGDTPDEFAANLAFIHKNASQVHAFCEDYKTHTIPHNGGGAGSIPTSSTPPTVPAPAAPLPPNYGNMFPPPPAPPGAHRVTINGIEEKTGQDKDGKTWNLFRVTFSDMRIASTFDPLLAAVARKIWQEGSGCVAFTKPAKNPKYLDLESIQRAA